METTGQPTETVKFSMRAGTPISVNEMKAAARRKTIKMFRRFLDALELELEIYQLGPAQNEFANLCFKQIRRTARVFRDEPKAADRALVMMTLDLTAAWDEWVARQNFKPALCRLHETLSRMVKGALKGWRSYQIALQLPDSPRATSEQPTEGVTTHGEVRSLD